MTATTPRFTTLPLKDPARLLEALQGDVDPAELRFASKAHYNKKTGCGISVASHLLQNIVLNTDESNADLYLRCCKRLLELDAPLADFNGEGVEYALTGWLGVGDEKGRERMFELADLYISAGAFDVNGTLPGVRQNRQAAGMLDFQPTGHKVLAVSIFLVNPKAVRYLLERGASLELGEVYPGEPAMTAMELAIDEGNSEIQAVVAEFTMKRRLAGTDTPINSPAPMRRRLSL